MSDYLNWGIVSIGSKNMVDILVHLDMTNGPILAPQIENGTTTPTIDKFWFVKRETQRNVVVDMKKFAYLF